MHERLSHGRDESDGNNLESLVLYPSSHVQQSYISIKINVYQLTYEEYEHKTKNSLSTPSIIVFVMPMSVENYRRLLINNSRVAVFVCA